MVSVCAFLVALGARVKVQPGDVIFSLGVVRTLCRLLITLFKVNRWDILK